MTSIQQAVTPPARGARAPFFPRRLFVTGASGYVGRNLVRHFVAKGCAVVGLVRSAKAAETVQGLGAIPYIGDILSPTLAEVMRDCDALIHAAADTSHGPASPQQLRTNQEGTRLVFAAAQAAGVTRAIHLSSESVLATGRPIVNADETWPLPRNSAGSYSRSKAAAEQIALSFSGGSLDVVIIRPRFVWGRDDTTALPHLVEAARSGQLAWIEGGSYLTSTTHIANLCLGIERALTSGRSGEVYFITDGAPVTFRQFASQLLETQGVEPPDKSVPRRLLHAIAIVGDALGKISRGRIVAPLTLQSFATSAVEVTLDISKARAELGYEPAISPEKGMAELRGDREWDA